MQEGKKTYDETKAEHEHGLYIMAQSSEKDGPPGSVQDACPLAPRLDLEFVFRVEASCFSNGIMQV